MHSSDRWLDPDVRDHGGLIDRIVPSPMMPHLMANWLERRARERWPDRTVSLVPADGPLGTPYDRLHTDGVRYVSFADWLCPTHCVEPLLCPMIRAPRTWEMGDAVTEWAADRARDVPTAAPALFTCRHVVYGVGMYPVHAAFEGLEALAAVADLPSGRRPRYWLGVRVSWGDCGPACRPSVTRNVTRRPPGTPCGAECSIFACAADHQPHGSPRHDQPQ